MPSNHNHIVASVKMLVVFMTMLITIGLGLIIYTLLTKSKPEDFKSTTIILGQPPGTKLSTMGVIDKHTVFLHLKKETEEEQVIVLDLNTGQIIKVIVIGATP